MELWAQGGFKGYLQCSDDSSVRWSGAFQQRNPFSDLLIDQICSMDGGEGISLMCFCVEISISW